MVGPFIASALRLIPLLCWHTSHMNPAQSCDILSSAVFAYCKNVQRFCWAGGQQKSSSTAVHSRPLQLQLVQLVPAFQMPWQGWWVGVQFFRMHGCGGLCKASARIRLLVVLLTTA